MSIGRLTQAERVAMMEAEGVEVDPGKHPCSHHPMGDFVARLYPDGVWYAALAVTPYGTSGQGETWLAALESLGYKLRQRMAHDEAKALDSRNAYTAFCAARAKVEP